jgi:hypothetical protein
MGSARPPNLQMSLAKRHGDSFEQNHRLGQILIRTIRYAIRTPHDRDEVGPISHSKRHEGSQTMSDVPSTPSGKRAAIDAFLRKAAHADR